MHSQVCCKETFSEFTYIESQSGVDGTQTLEISKCLNIGLIERNSGGDVISWIVQIGMCPWKGP